MIIIVMPSFPLYRDYIKNHFPYHSRVDMGRNFPYVVDDWDTMRGMQTRTIYINPYKVKVPDWFRE